MELASIVKELKEISNTSDESRVVENKSNINERDKAKKTTERKTFLARKRETIVADIGFKIFQKHKKETELESFTSVIESAKEREKAINAQIEEIKRQLIKTLITPKNLMKTIGVFTLLFLFLTIRRALPDEFLTVSQDGTAKTVAAKNNRDPLTGQNATMQTGSSSVKKTSYQPPEELRHQPGWPTFPLSQIPQQLSRDKNWIGHNGTTVKFFSQKERYLVILSMKNNASNVRIWDSKTGEELNPNSKDTNYFSFPLSFSPDEKNFATLDGDFLRVWAIEDSNAKLIQNDNLGRDKWNSIGWTEEDTLVLRKIDARPEKYQVLKKIEGKFESYGVEIPATQFGEIAVSPDGMLIGSISKSKNAKSPNDHIELQIFSTHPVKKLFSTVIENEFGKELTMPRPPFINSYTSSEHIYEPSNHISFSPDGRYLLTSTTNRKNQRCISFFDTTDLGKYSRFFSEALNSDRSVPEKHEFLFFTKDNNSLIGTSKTNEKTIQGITVKDSLIVVDMKTGDVTKKFDLNDNQKLGTIEQREKMNYLSNYQSLSEDGNSFIRAYYQDGKKILIKRWDLNSGVNDFSIEKELVTRSRGNLTLSPNGEVLVLSGNRTNQSLRGINFEFIEIDHWAKLKNDLDKGDILWKDGKKNNAFECYCSIIADDIAGVLDADLPRAYSRCIDVFAERREADKAKFLIVQSQREKLKLAPETEVGKRLVVEFLSEQRRKKTQENNQEIAKQEIATKAIRDANRKKFLPSEQLSKAGFIDRLKKYLSKGSITNNFVNAIYEDYSFEDIFGEPDTSVEVANSEKIISFRCNDGIIQLIVIYAGGRTFVKELNQY